MTSGAMTCADAQGNRIPAHVRPTMHDVELAIINAFPLLQRQ